MLFDSPFVSLPVNDRGRDFCIGDLHGCRQMLDRLMKAVAFEPDNDRLFSVGDLIHRGPESTACLCLAEEPWFFPVMGNHEAMQIAAYSGAYWVEDSKLETGLEDIAGADAKAIAREHARYQTILDRLPLAIETQLPDGRRIGIVHAGLRSPYRWADVRAIFRRDADLDHPRVALQPLLLWDRLPANSAFASSYADVVARLAALNLEHRLYQEIEDIDLLISGHCQTPLLQPMRSGMRLFLDTGAGFADGFLTMVEVSSGRCWQVPDARVKNHAPVIHLEKYLELPAELGTPPTGEVTSLMEELQRAWSR